MNKEEIKQSKEVLREIAKEISPEERKELLKQYMDEMIFGKRGRF